MGAKLTADEAALAPILREIGGRGLVFLDDGSSSRSLVGAVAPSARRPGGARRPRARRHARRPRPSTASSAGSRRWRESAASRSARRAPCRSTVERIAALGALARGERHPARAGLERLRPRGAMMARHRRARPLHELPYRPCVGIVLLNREGLVFLGRRYSEAQTDEAADAYAWQMPQGGIDTGESPREAAFRELHEETGVRSAELLAEAPEWYCYDLPSVGRRARLARPLQGAEPEMVRVPLHRTRRGDRHPPRDRAQARIRRLALGAHGSPARPHHSLQAAGLRARRRGLRPPRRPRRGEDGSAAAVRQAGISLRGLLP